MKRIVLCFDGTWNKPAEAGLSADKRVETNVYRFFDSLAGVGPDGAAQQSWYNEGVGTSWWNKLPGGVFGEGLDKHILDGYRHLVNAYEDGDEVFVVGFSRGAYAARSMVGMIRNCGLVRKEFAVAKVLVAYGIYRTRDDGPDSIAAKAFRSMFAHPLTIRFLGVWDTVGELGIPFHFADRLNHDFYKFHDTALSNIVDNAYQAIALDEHRQAYQACLWDPPEKPSQTVEQHWFIGAHADVGGGYLERELSDLTLLWMQEKAAALGLGLTPVAVGDDNYRGTLHDSYRDFLDGLYCCEYPPFYRRVFATKFGNEVFDAAIDRRRQDIDLNYHPQNEGLPVEAAQILSVSRP
ncbi:MAG TPA: DUF2235 domain-containing protein [Gemmataceae bacterium]|nr:DUF2235 domain-containing protein [Gemmataceae bacterium]